MSTQRFTTKDIKEEIRIADGEDSESHDITNTTFVHSTCSICFQDYSNPNIVAITNCGHHACKECMFDFLNNSSTCFTCRADITTISTIDWGIISFDEFKSKYSLEVKLFHPVFTGRQNTSSLHRQVTHFNNYSSSDDENRSLKHNIHLPEVPIVLSTQTSTLSLENNTVSILYSYPFEYKDNGIGTLVLASPYSAIVTKLLDIFLVLDVSGSMRGDRILFCKEAAKTMVNICLNTGMRITIITFDNYVVQIFPLQQITELNLEKVLSLIDNITHVGSTDYNVVFQFLPNVISNRDSIVMFLSDGAPSSPTNLSLLNNLYERFPQLVMYVISMGNDVDSKYLLPLLCDRHFDVAIYKHISNASDFPKFIETIIGESTSIYATDFKITFSGIVPISSKTETIDDEKSFIFIPVLYSNSSTQIAFTRDLSSIIDINISVEYTKDGIIYQDSATIDRSNILDEIVSKNFAIKRYADREVNTILSNNNLSNKTKYELLKNIYDDAVSNKIYFGIFFEDFDKALSTIMTDIIQISTRNNNIKNLVAEQSNRSGSMSRAISDSISRSVTHNNTNVIFEEDEDEDDI